MELRKEIEKKINDLVDVYLKKNIPINKTRKFLKHHFKDIVIPKLKDIEHKGKDVAEFRELAMKVFNEVMLDRHYHDKDTKKKVNESSRYKFNIGDLVKIKVNGKNPHELTEVAKDEEARIVDQDGDWYIVKFISRYMEKMYRKNFGTPYFTDDELELVDKPESSNFEEWIEESYKYKKNEVVYVKKVPYKWRKVLTKDTPIYIVHTWEFTPMGKIHPAYWCYWDCGDMRYFDSIDEDNLYDKSEDSNIEEWIEEGMITKFEKFKKIN